MLQVNLNQNNMLLIDLDYATRQYMLAEFDNDVKCGTLYVSGRLNPSGQIAYPVALRQALEQYSIGWLSNALAPHRNLYESRNARQVRTPVNAMWMLAENEFNHFYMRGVCHRATSEGISHVIAYRAQDAANPRSRSQALLGKNVDAQTLLIELRNRQSMLTGVGLPISGLSVRLP